jgi:hypothetical protein
MPAHWSRLRAYYHEHPKQQSEEHVMEILRKWWRSPRSFMANMEWKDSCRSGGDHDAIDAEL